MNDDRQQPAERERLTLKQVRTTATLPFVGDNMHEMANYVVILADALLASQEALVAVTPHCPNCGTFEVLNHYDERYSCTDCLDLTDNNSSYWFSFEPNYNKARAALLPDGSEVRP